MSAEKAAAEYVEQVMDAALKKSTDYAVVFDDALKKAFPGIPPGALAAIASHCWLAQSIITVMNERFSNLDSAATAHQALLVKRRLGEVMKEEIQRIAREMN